MSTPNPPSFYMQAQNATRPKSPLSNVIYLHHNASSDTVGSSETSPVVAEHVDAGRLDEHFYDNTLQWWRAGLRRVLVNQVESQSDIIAAMQQRVRRPWLDTFFVYTSSLGTHTFFLTGLPMFFFFGYHDLGRGLLLVLAFGVYISSFIKDLMCSPRPFVPPVTRLTISYHHLEYGFPSTHSTNSVSIALYVFVHIHHLYTEASISATVYGLSIAALMMYVWSIVYGRIYTGMHSFIDCAVGILLGAVSWAMQYLFLDTVDTWVATSGWIVPSTIVPICLLMVNQHPQPVDDCPCFEDAIAFVSVGMGVLVGRWYAFRNGFGNEFFVTGQPGSSYDTWANVCVWWIFAVIKTTVGIVMIFTWRILAKSLLHFVLPPTFRFLASIFTLPNRRFYTPATDYTTVPPEKGLHPIPSVIDLPSQLEMEIDEEFSASTGRAARRNVGDFFGHADVKNRKAGNGSNGHDVSSGDVKSGKLANESGVQFVDEKNCVVEGGPVIHYDADVLTKVVVYTGIGILATQAAPIMFEILGWGA
jgi:membrane-associated phospholipid phosphatase